MKKWKNTPPKTHAQPYDHVTPVFLVKKNIFWDPRGPQHIKNTTDHLDS